MTMLMSDIHNHVLFSDGSVCVHNSAKLALPPVVLRLVYPWLQLRPVRSGTWFQLNMFGDVATQSVFNKR